MSIELSPITQRIYRVRTVCYSIAERWLPKLASDAMAMAEAAVICDDSLLLRDDGLMVLRIEDRLAQMLIRVDVAQVERKCAGHCNQRLSEAVELIQIYAALKPLHLNAYRAAEYCLRSRTESKYWKEIF